MDNINNRYNNDKTNEYNRDADRQLELVMNGQRQTINKPQENLHHVNDNELKFPWQV